LILFASLSKLKKRKKVKQKSKKQKSATKDSPGFISPGTPRIKNRKASGFIQ